MNPLVEQMLVAQHRNDLELEILELALAEDCKCESTHNHGEVTCSEDVTYLLSSCTPAKKVCSSMGKAVRQWISEGDENVCGDCDRDLDKCWTIRPI